MGNHTAFPVLPGGSAKKFAELAGKIVAVIETGMKGHFGDSQAGTL